MSLVFTASVLPVWGELNRTKSYGIPSASWMPTHCPPPSLTARRARLSLVLMLGIDDCLQNLPANATMSA